MITPRATEKAYVAEGQHVYIFYVDKAMTKQAIAKAIAEEFKVTVTDVRTLTRKGKATRFSRGKHAYPGTTYRQDHKVAYITVKAGDKIPVFAEAKAEDSKEAKKAAKSDDKTSKKSDDKKPAKKPAKKVAQKGEDK